MGPVRWYSLKGVGKEAQAFNGVGKEAWVLKPKDQDSNPISTTTSWARILASLHLSFHTCKMEQ